MHHKHVNPSELDSNTLILRTFRQQVVFRQTFHIHMQGWVMNYQKTFALMSLFIGLSIAGLFPTEGVAF